MKISALTKIGKSVGMTLGGLSLPGILIRIGVELVLSVAVDMAAKKFSEAADKSAQKADDIA